MLDHWRKASDRGIPRVTGAAATSSPDLVQPGFIFIMDFGGGVGHTGLVEKVLNGHLVTIASINKGFLDYRGA